MKKYNLDDKSDMFSEIPKKNSEYKKRLLNVKSKYMDDYNNSNKTSKYMEDRHFNNILETYFEDYNKIKDKFGFRNNEEKDKKDFANIKVGIDETEYLEKKESFKQIFSQDLFYIQDFNFDVCDNLINDLPKDNNNSLLKTIQTKEDYELRLQGFPKNKKNEIQEEENTGIKEEKSEENKINLNSENNKELNNEINNNNEVKNSINNIEDNKQIKDKDNDIKLTQPKLEGDDENLIILENKNNDYMKFEDIIKYDFEKDYKIPEYKIPNKIKLEIENQKKEEEKQKLIYEENKNNNIIIPPKENDNNDLKTTNDLIKNDNNNNNEGGLIKSDDNNNDLNMKKEPVNEESKNEEKINNIPEENKNNFDENNNFKKDKDEQFDEIDVNDLKEIEDDEDENKKYNDFHT